MTMTPQGSATNGAEFQLRIRGQLSAEGAKWFAGMDVRLDGAVESAQTIITGYVQDQAELQGLIRRIADLGLTLISVNRVDSEPPV
jgi:hypothetical protein